MRHLPIFAFAVGLLTIACGARRSSFESSASENQPGQGKETPNGSGSLGGNGNDGDAGPAACAATVSNANRAEVDIILVIDTSGSMNEETDQVKANLNTFAQSIGNTGLDYNVIMIASKPKTIFGIPMGLCIQPPLGGPDCTDGPSYHHLDTAVESFDSLKIVLNKYSQYSAWLRPTAYKVFIEVTDDNSELAFASFDSQLLAKSPQNFGDATNRRYIFNSICGYKRNTAILSSTKCSTAENIGEEYQKLSQLTGGTIDSVCETSYASVFDNIAKGLVTKLGCDFKVPTGPNGEDADPATVVVTYTPGNGTASKPLVQVTDASKCETTPDAWYYDDPTEPTKILFCPNTCAGPGADTAGKLEVAVGCKAPPPK
jgi:hypothetical protein